MLKKRYRTAKHLDGVIDLERLWSGSPKCLERDPGLFFDLTYPSEDVNAMLLALSRRFSKGEAEGNGLILAEAMKGLGKSHALLMAYRLFNDPQIAKGWMEGRGYSWAAPSDPVIVIKKFTDERLPFDSVWTPLAEALHVDWKKEHYPSLRELRSALSGKSLILIFDELERGISNIVDPARRSQNLSFLQMLSEEANRTNRVTLIAAIYDGTVEPGSTLKRVPRVELRFRKTGDRAAIVRHRLFSNADSYDRSQADSLIRSYINAWARLGVQTSDDYLSRLRQAFPFLPELIEIIFERISATGGFQGTRGALGLLASMLDAAPAGALLLAAGHCKLTDQACADRLQDLDPAGNLINCAQRNFQDLKAQPHAEALASAVLLASIAPGVKGLSRDELIRHVAFPGCDPNEFETTFQAFRTYGSYFHERESRFFFDLEENEHAKVEIEAIRIKDEKATDEVKNIWKQDLFKESQHAVIFSDVESTRNALSQLPKTSLRFVLSPRRLSSVERHALLYGAEMRNQILLLEPREETANFLSNRDIISSARRAIASFQLAPTATSERRTRYERINGQERKSVRDLIRSAGVVYVQVEKWGDRPEDSIFEIESPGQSFEKQAILEYLRSHLYPQPLFIEHLRERLGEFYGFTVAQVDRMYKNTPGYPVPTTVHDVSDAIVALVEDRLRVLGLKHQRKDYCGEMVNLGPGELGDAILSQPWPSTPSVRGTESPRPLPIDQEQERTKMPPPKEPPTTRPVPVIEMRSTLPCKTKAELRQAVAEKLTGEEGTGIQKVHLEIYGQYENADFAGFPSPIRGAITRNGNLVVQIEMTFPGPMDKAEVEHLCESLPVFATAAYSARLSVTQQKYPETDPSGDEEIV